MTRSYSNAAEPREFREMSQKVKYVKKKGIVGEL